MTSERDPAAAPSEQEVYAEHRAALEATLFEPSDGPTLVLELSEGTLRPVGAS